MAKQKIYLGQADGSATPTIVEGLAVDAILPGSLVERSASGLSTSNNAATVFNSECLVAQEIGSGRGAEITTAYTIGDTAQAVKVKSGEFVNVRVATGRPSLAFAARWWPVRCEESKTCYSPLCLGYSDQRNAGSGNGLFGIEEDLLGAISGGHL